MTVIKRKKTQKILSVISVFMICMIILRFIIRILDTITSKFKGGPVGLNPIATAVGEDPGTLEEVYEPFLIKEGFINRTPRGREVTDLAYKHLGMERIMPENTLF